MSKAQFVYVTYIAATPERIWTAITDPEFTRQYWDAENISDWKAGSRWEHWRTDGPRTLAMVGKIVESAPPRRLVLTWAPLAEESNATAYSRVTFEIEAIGDTARLTITHDELEPGSAMLRDISDGWPGVLSSLKSFLETGRPLRTWAGR